MQKEEPAYTELANWVLENRFLFSRRPYGNITWGINPFLSSVMEAKLENDVQVFPRKRRES